MVVRDGVGGSGEGNSGGGEEVGDDDSEGSGGVIRCIDR